MLNMTILFHHSAADNTAGMNGVEVLVVVPIWLYKFTRRSGYECFKGNQNIN
jgi:hypothetical protein